MKKLNATSYVFGIGMLLLGCSPMFGVRMPGSVEPKRNTHYYQAGKRVFICTYCKTKSVYPTEKGVTGHIKRDHPEYIGCFSRAGMQVKERASSSPVKVVSQAQARDDKRQAAAAVAAAGQAASASLTMELTDQWIAGLLAREPKSDNTPMITEMVVDKECPLRLCCGDKAK